MESAYFKDIRNRIIPILDNAKEEVVVAMAWFTSGELFQALINCIGRGVHVELVLLDNATNFMYYAPDFNELIKAGGVLRIAKVENGFMHHKFCVIDNSIVITGSYNWTYYAETRNIENIVISDNKSVIQQYRGEFDSLVHRVRQVSQSPRLEWDEIEECRDINFEELNYEIERIAKVRNLPERKVVKSSTVVSIEERPINPVSKYEIGIMATTKGNNRSMLTIIPMGSKLPYTATRELYNYSDHRDKVVCVVLYGNGNSRQPITEKAITAITTGRSDEELTIRVQFTLVPSGDLFAEICCLETGKVITVKTSNPDFVTYAE